MSATSSLVRRRLWRTCLTLLSTAALVALTTPPTALAVGDVVVTDVYVDKARYAPGAQVPVVALLTNNSGSGWTGPVQLSMTHLAQAAGSVSQQASVPAGQQIAVTLNWTAPSTDFRGYLAEVTADGSKDVTAVDVSSTWTRYPRYGYLHDFPVGETTEQARAKVQQLVRDYHLNAVQLYDWMWRHEKPIKRVDGVVADTWDDWSGIPIARQSVVNQIDAAHDAGVAAMPYAMTYAGLQDYEQVAGVSPTWGLFNDTAHAQQWQFDFGDLDPQTNLWMFNPQDPNWRDHIVGEYVDQVDTMGFDGVHMDQLGEWQGTYHTHDGSPVPLTSSFSGIVDAAKAALTANDPNRAVTAFNLVDGVDGGFGVADVTANADVDFLYSEIWDAAPTYQSLKNYVQAARRDAPKVNGASKAMVLAAYMNYGENLGPRYEAENATRDGVGVNTNHTGYTGTGFVDGYGDVGDWVEFSVTVPEERDYSLNFSYANATGAPVSRTLLVDGVDTGTVRFPFKPTHNSWDTWDYDAYKVVHLTPGTHTLRLRVDTAGWVNLDNLTLGTFDEASVRLTNAAFAAMGASHIEMGEGGQMLTHPYFPNHYKQMPNSLSAWMKDYYDFTTAYENLLFDAVNTDSGAQFVKLTGVATSPDATGNTVWTTLSRTSTHDVINLVNLIGNDDVWRNAASTAPTLNNIPVKYYIGPDMNPTGVYVASPDTNNGVSASLPYTTGTDSSGRYLQFTLPSLRYWDMVYIPRGFSPPAADRYEAETATKTAVTVGTDHAGYTGTGFVDSFGPSDSGVSFVVQAPTSGSYTLNFRYGNGGAPAVRTVAVDGAIQTRPTFGGLGNWDTWSDVAVTVQLSAGLHTVVLWRGPQDTNAINVDHLSVTSS